MRRSSSSCRPKRLTKRRLVRHEFSRSTCANELARYRCVSCCGIEPISAAPADRKHQGNDIAVVVHDTDLKVGVGRRNRNQQPFVRQRMHIEHQASNARGATTALMCINPHRIEMPRGCARCGWAAHQREAPPQGGLGRGLGLLRRARGGARWSDSSRLVVGLIDPDQIVKDVGYWQYIVKKSAVVTADPLIHSCCGELGGSVDDGRSAGDAGEPFYQFRLDDHVPADHMLRGIDRFLDLGELRRQSRTVLQHDGSAFYRSRTECSDPDPAGLGPTASASGSEPAWLCERCISIWPIGGSAGWPGRGGAGHSTFSKNRHGRFRDSDAFRTVSEMVVSRCIEEGLVGGEGFAVDASLIAADANKQRSVSSAEHTDWRVSPPAVVLCGGTPRHPGRSRVGRGQRDGAEVRLSSRPRGSGPGALQGHAFFAYADNYLIDLKAAVILRRGDMRDPPGRSRAAITSRSTAPPIASNSTKEARRRQR